MRGRCPFQVFLSVSVGFCTSHLSPLPHGSHPLLYLPAHREPESCETGLSPQWGPQASGKEVARTLRVVIRVSQHAGGSWLRKLGVEQGSWECQPPPGNEWEGRPREGAADPGTRPVYLSWRGHVCEFTASWES